MAAARILRSMSAAVPLAALLLLASAGAAGAVAKIYWAEKLPGRINRANLDGSNVETVVTGPNDIQNCTFAGGLLYFVVTGTSPGDGRIMRAYLDGSGKQDVKTGLTFPRGVAVDLPQGRMYWSVTGKIQRSNLDGSGVVDLIPGLNQPADVELDVANGKIYWTDVNADVIQRANLDGTSLQTVVTSASTDGPLGLDLDLAAGKMYWAAQGGATRRIMRANFNGTTVDPLPIQPDPQGVAVHPQSGKVYWTDQTDGVIRRVNLDGSGSVENVLPGIVTAAGAKIYDPMPLSLPGPSSGALLALMAGTLLAGGLVMLRRMALLI